MPAIFECVPNISEGRRSDVIASIAAAATDGSDVVLVDTQSDPSHNRSVFTLIGSADGVLEAALRLSEAAIERIDLRAHKGEHPRMGAVDVIPFVPVADASVPEAVQLARRCAGELWRRFKLPSYFYGAAATRPERRRLPDLRKGEFEGLQTAVREPARHPDVGEPALHPSAGIVAVGARSFLIAFNVNLASSDRALAERIAAGLRESSGGLTGIQAKGFALSEGAVQVSMNVTDTRAVSLYRVVELVRREAAAAGVSVSGCELVGLAPLAAIADAATYYLRLDDIDPAQITW